MKIKFRIFCFSVGSFINIFTSWHLGIFLMLLGSKMPAELDVFRTLKMLLVHDLVEVYAGDTRVYDTLVRKIDDGELMYDATKIANKMEREESAASKLFSILPEDLHDVDCLQSLSKWGLWKLRLRRFWTKFTLFYRAA